jgi:hypothetical protein
MHVQCDWDRIQAKEFYWRASADEEELYRCPSTYCKGEELSLPNAPYDSVIR